jgi:hypothetical protein
MAFMNEYFKAFLTDSVITKNEVESDLTNTKVHRKEMLQREKLRNFMDLLSYSERNFLHSLGS